MCRDGCGWTINVYFFFLDFVSGQLTKMMMVMTNFIIIILFIVSWLTNQPTTHTQATKKNFISFSETFINRLENEIKTSGLVCWFYFSLLICSFVRFPCMFVVCLWWKKKFDSVKLRERERKKNDKASHRKRIWKSQTNNSQ